MAVYKAKANAGNWTTHQTTAATIRALMDLGKRVEVRTRRGGWRVVIALAEWYAVDGTPVPYVGTFRLTEPSPRRERHIAFGSRWTAIDCADIHELREEARDAG